MHPILLTLGKSPARISAPWTNLSVAYPTETDTTGARTITMDGENFALSFEYSIDGGAYTTYTGGFSLSSGQTLNWRGTFSQNTNKTCNVYVDGARLDTFTATATGFP